MSAPQVERSPLFSFVGGEVVTAGYPGAEAADMAQNGFDNMRLNRECGQPSCGASANIVKDPGLISLTSSSLALDFDQPLNPLSPRPKM